MAETKEENKMIIEGTNRIEKLNEYIEYGKKIIEMALEGYYTSSIVEVGFEEQQLFINFQKDIKFCLLFDISELIKKEIERQLEDLEEEKGMLEYNCNKQREKESCE